MCVKYNYICMYGYIFIYLSIYILFPVKSNIHPLPKINLILFLLYICTMTKFNPVIKIANTLELQDKLSLRAWQLHSLKYSVGPTILTSTRLSFVSTLLMLVLKFLPYILYSFSRQALTHGHSFSGF